MQMQAFKEARDAVADAAAERAPGGTTAGDDKEVARVLRCVTALPQSGPQSKLQTPFLLTSDVALRHTGCSASVRWAHTGC